MKKRSEQYLLSQTGHHGFSLSELVIVASILGVVASLLFPALQRARDQARRMHCVNSESHQKAESMSMQPARHFVVAQENGLTDGAGLLSQDTDGSATSALQHRVPDTVTGAQPIDSHACITTSGIRVVMGEAEFKLMVSDAMIRCGCGF